jgi:hypothetical protein
VVNAGLPVGIDDPAKISAQTPFGNLSLTM